MYDFDNDYGFRDHEGPLAYSLWGFWKPGIYAG